MSTNRPRRTLTVDNMADILLPLAQSISTLVAQLEDLVEANCQSTNISEEAANLLDDAGNLAIRHAKKLMLELRERREAGRGAQPLQ